MSRCNETEPACVNLIVSQRYLIEAHRETGQTRTPDKTIMNRFEHDTNDAPADVIPLFTSSLMALFHVLRKNFNERRIAAKPAEKSLQTEKE